MGTGGRGPLPSCSCSSVASSCGVGLSAPTTTTAGVVGAAASSGSSRVDARIEPASTLVEVSSEPEAEQPAAAARWRADSDGSDASVEW